MKNPSKPTHEHSWWHLLTTTRGIVYKCDCGTFNEPSPSAWRGQQMLAEMRANCDKVGGVMIEVKQPILGGSTYSCEAKLDKEH